MAAVVVALSALAPASPETDLLRLMRARLDLARPVALAKLYSRAPVEDRMREAAVLDAVRREAPAHHVNPDRAVRFFEAQIEASKMAQRAWQTKWAREGAPFDPRPDLAKDIRPKLDLLTVDLLDALARVSPRAMGQRGPGPSQGFLAKAWRIALAGCNASRR